MLLVAHITAGGASGEQALPFVTQRRYNQASIARECSALVQPRPCHSFTDRVREVRPARFVDGGLLTVERVKHHVDTDAELPEALGLRRIAGSYYEL